MSGSFNRRINGITETWGALLTALTGSAAHVLQQLWPVAVSSPGVSLARGRFSVSIPSPEGQPGKCDWVQGEGVHSDPWGQLCLIPFGEGAPVAKIKLGWGCSSSKGQGCNLLCCILDQGSTNSSL